MPNNKPYTTPVWWLSMIIFLRLALFIIIVVLPVVRGDLSFEEVGDDYAKRVLISQLISVLIVVLLLLAEAITYWKIRTLIVRRKLVWCHLIGWILFQMLLPVTSYLVKWWWKTQKIDDYNVYNNFIDNFHVVVGVVVGGSWIAGHICFIIVLVDAYRKKKARLTSQPGIGQDILSDHA